MAGTKRQRTDVLLDQIGDIGRWQIVSFIVLSLFSIPVAWQTLVVVFHAPPDADFWCTRPAAFANWTVDQWRHYSTPRSVDKHGDPVWDGCRVFALNYSTAPPDPDRPPPPLSNATVKCPHQRKIPDRWQFDHAFHKWTIREHFGLVCEYDYLIGPVTGSYLVGTLIGVFFGGMVSDRFGRRPAILCLLGLTLISAVAVTFSNSIMLYIVLRFILALAVQAVYITNFVFCMEIVGAKWRVVLGLLFQVPFAFGFISLAGIAYLITNWQHLQLAISVPLVLFILYYWAVSESPRWLLAAGMVDSAEAIIESVAEINDREYDETVQLVPQHEARTHVHVKELLRHRQLRWHTLRVWAIWLANGLAYYGLLFSFDDLDGDVFLNAVAGGAVELAGYLLGIGVCLWLGRRWAIFAFMQLSGVCLLATIGFSRGEYQRDWPLLLFTMLARLCISSSFGLVFVYSAEVFPTGLRNTALGSCSACSKFGAVFAPFVARLAHHYTHLPEIVLAVLVMVCGGLPLSLPETRYLKLPDTLHEAGTLGSDHVPEPHWPGTAVGTDRQRTPNTDTNGGTVNHGFDAIQEDADAEL
ncbi:organic cation transporter protein-like [Pollicipes pollicipes]|uniref:organic cation transporter protein-like n=1 Tax=Pollicipes pollicipes TaxID=41117 RepID=UPI00188495DA|nr:organic cation transporter protein-like [Pollicipes pollicipes]